MKRSAVVAVVAIASLSSRSSAADDKTACFEAASKGQSLRNDHKLVEAREQFRVCARITCPPVVAKDCAAWLDGVEQGLPTVVISAKDGAGKDLIDVKVAVDGKPLAERLDGDALPIDPGPHTLHVVGPDGVTRDEQFLVREGAKNQSVALVLGAPPAPAPPPEPPPAAAPAPEAPQPPPPGFPWRTVGWIAGGAGVVGLAVGTAFGFKAISDKNSAHCDSSGACDPGPLGNLDTSSAVSTVAFIAGGALLAGGAVLVLFPPRTGGPSPAALRVAPSVGAGTGGVLLAGSW